MFARFGSLDSDTIELQLGESPEGKPQFLRLSQLRGLSGGLEVDSKGMTTTCQLDEAVVFALRLVFGTVVLQARGPALLGKAKVSWGKQGGITKGEVFCETLSAPSLSVDVGTIHVEAKVAFQGLRLAIDGSTGTIESTSCRLEQFELRIGDVELSAPALDGGLLRLGWGADGFWMDARRLESALLSLSVAGTKTTAKNFAASELYVRDADWSLRGVNSDEMGIRANFEATRGKDHASPTACRPS
jgi:hypothetical protein